MFELALLVTVFPPLLLGWLVGLAWTINWFDWFCIGANWTVCIWPDGVKIWATWAGDAIWQKKNTIKKHVTVHSIMSNYRPKVNYKGRSKNKELQNKHSLLLSLSFKKRLMFIVAAGGSQTKLNALNLLHFSKTGSIQCTGSLFVSGNLRSAELCSGPPKTTSTSKKAACYDYRRYW